jgi:type IV pilus assembly protein PilA
MAEFGSRRSGEGWQAGDRRLTSAAMNAPPSTPAPPVAPAKKGLSCVVIGLIVLAASVPILGVLSALAIYGVRRYLAAAKTAEAKNTVGAIGRSAAAAYETERLDAEGRQVRALCASRGPAAPGHGPVPRTIAAVRGMKYMPGGSGTDFDTGTDDGGWKCLRFSVSVPSYYQYHYNQGSGYVMPSLGTSTAGFEAAAIGDLDADGIHSKFARNGEPSPSGQLVLGTQIAIENEFE